MKSHYAGLFGLALTGMFALSANAADMGPTWAGYKDVPYAAVTWTGFHVGVNGGYASSQDSQLGYTDSTVPVTYGGVSSAGGFGGGQIGYDWQGLLGYRPLVLGVEADIQVSSAQGRSADSAGDLYKSRLEDFGTVRGRIGYAADRTLVYFTGGFAYGNVRNEAIVNAGANATDDFVANPSATGYVLGGGVEYKLNRSLSVKGEYQYINLGKSNPVDAVNGAGAFSANGGSVRDDAFHTFRVGLNWFPFPATSSLK
jgi:outer membrane immunogenic protein